MTPFPISLPFSFIINVISFSKATVVFNSIDASFDSPGLITSVLFPNIIFPLYDSILNINDEL